MRQLVAILFTDMSGYTALMQENENLARMKRQRMKEVLDATVQKFNGRIIQYYGDGALSIFSSAIDSVHCAISIQQQFLQEPRVDARAGIHTGDVTMDDEAIYGDSVNVASRIESIAVPGSVLISEKVFQEVRNHQDIHVRELGLYELKNVKDPIRVYAITNEGLVVPERGEMQGKISTPSNRLAVLPFVNLSADADNEYFSDGVTEELLNALTKVNGLQVTSRTSVFAFKGKQADIRDIARQLNVDKVLEGSVRKSGTRVRITAQLINANDGYHLWSESYDRHLTDIFEVQDEISAIIAGRLREDLETKRGHLVNAPTRNVEAYTSYLKGLHFRNKMTPADARNAIAYFEQAISLEPEYAHAYAMTAAAYAYLGSTGQMMPSKAFEIVHRYADKAMELDDSIAESHIASASANLYYDWEWDKAYASLQKALKINPGVTAAHQLLAFYYVITGQVHEAVKIMELAVRLDPLSPLMNQFLGNIYIFAKRYDDAINQAHKVLEIEPGMRSSVELQAWGTGMKGDWQAALELFEEVHRLTGHPLKGLMGVGFALAKLGRNEEVEEVVRKIAQRQREDPDAVLDGDLAAISLAMGDREQALHHIHQCIEKRTAPVNFFLEYPIFDDLKGDPRFEAVKRSYKPGNEV